jgi:hypothetical protein
LRRIGANYWAARVTTRAIATCDRRRNPGASRVELRSHALQGIEPAPTFLGVASRTIIWSLLHNGLSGKGWPIFPGTLPLNAHNQIGLVVTLGISVDTVKAFWCSGCRGL